MSRLCALLTVALAVCQAAPIPKLADLGHGLDEQSSFWPGEQRFNVTRQYRCKGDCGVPWYAWNAFLTGEHVGTHVDAPFHFNEDGWKLSEIPLERMFVPGALIDVSDKVKDDSDFEFQKEDIEEWERTHGSLPEDSILLIRFGWSSRYSNRTEYFGMEKNNASELSFPGLSIGAANYIFEKGNIFGVGVDTPSLDPGKDTNFEAHLKLLGAQIFGIENLNLENDIVPAKDFMLHVLPLKITNGTGSPARVIALVNP